MVIKLRIKTDDNILHHHTSQIFKLISNSPPPPLLLLLLGRYFSLVGSLKVNFGKLWVRTFHRQAELHDCHTNQQRQISYGLFIFAAQMCRDQTTELYELCCFQTTDVRTDEKPAVRRLRGLPVQCD